jgi:hypothetical protein
LSFCTISAFAQQDTLHHKHHGRNDSSRRVSGINNTGSNSQTMPDNRYPRKETRTNKPASNNGRMVKTDKGFTTVPDPSSHVQTENGQAVSMDTVGTLNGSVVYKNTGNSSAKKNKTSGKQKPVRTSTQRKKSSSTGAANNEKS